MNDILLDKTKEDIWKWFYCKPKYTLEEGLTIVENDRGREKAKNDASTMSFEEIVAWEKEELQSLSYLRSPHVWKSNSVGTGKVKVLLDDFKIMGNGKDKVVLDDVKALEFMNDREEIGGGCFGDIESYPKKGKREIFVAIITSCKPNVLGDMSVTLKDLSGTTSDTIHYKVLSSKDGYAKDIKVGSALILRNVSVFCDKSKTYALNITIKNLVKIIKKDTVVEDADGASSITDVVKDKAELIEEVKELSVAAQGSDSMAYLRILRVEDLDKAKDIMNLIKETKKHTRGKYVYIAKVKLDRN
uniref:Homologous recombination OB-fold protein OB-fold domain-containing protein n=1 Tax=Tanacetum cinerariifolium TaxID=118510 RepID=A0A6L2L0W7_TANCI|nr:hypothetical protein [Tanacetum cinerariifolium]